MKYIVPKYSREYYLLVDEDKKQMLGFVCSVDNRNKSFKVRRFDEEHFYDNEEALPDFRGWMRTAICDNTPTILEGKKALEAYFGVLEIKEGEVMKILAQMKNLEVFGKIEIVLKVEGLPKKNG